MKCKGGKVNVMPSRRSGGTGATVRRKHSLGNLRRAHPASGAEWNVQVVRGKMSSKCLWHACRALVLGLTLMLLGAGMATIGYYADYLSMAPEFRGNSTIRVKNDLKGFHLSNFSYVGPIVMGFGGFIVVASCVMTFEARDSAAKVVPARLRAGGGSKATVRSNQSSSASQRRAIGMQLQSSRWDQHFGVFRSSPVGPSLSATCPTTFDRDAITAELIKFSKSLSASARFSPQLRRLTYTGSVPNLSTTISTHPSHAYQQHHHHIFANSTNIAHLLSPHHQKLILDLQKRHHRRHHRHNHNGTTRNSNSSSVSRHSTGVKSRGTRISNSLIQRSTRDSCALLQPPTNRMLWHTTSFDENGRMDPISQRTSSGGLGRTTERTRRSDTAKRHVLARQKPIEHQEQDEDRQNSPLRNRRRCSTMSDSSYSGRWTVRCTSLASRTSSIESRRVHVDLHSPEVIPKKSILRSPRHYCTAVSAAPSVEKEFRSQVSVCSEPPAPMRQLSGQSSQGSCFPEENIEGSCDDKSIQADVTLSAAARINNDIELQNLIDQGAAKKPRPDSLHLKNNELTKTTGNPEVRLLRSNSSRTFYRPRIHTFKEIDDSIYYISSNIDERTNQSQDFYDSLQVINERRNTQLKADSETTLTSVDASSAIAGKECIASNLLLMMEEIPEMMPGIMQNLNVEILDDVKAQSQSLDTKLIG